MLIDIFARRYEEVPLRTSFDQRDARLLTQAFRILSEDLYPYFVGGAENAPAVKFWTNLEARLSRELGLKVLSSHWLSYSQKWNGNDHVHTHKDALANVCEKWFLLQMSGVPDEYVKERLSLVELGMRERESELSTMNASPIEGPRSISSNYANHEAMRRKASEAFQIAVEELNTRFRQAGYPLHYHNGFIQFSTDDTVQREVESPFWSMVSDPIWKNVDLDMKEALDLRDTDGRDPAFYAARALESTIKIISDRKGFTTGKERGAHNFIENLAKNANGYIASWEASSLKTFFSEVRNPLGHGAGSAEMPSLTRQ